MLIYYNAERLNDSLDIGARSITLSTVGVPKTLARLAAAFTTTGLSKHATYEESAASSGGDGNARRREREFFF